MVGLGQTGNGVAATRLKHMEVHPRYCYVNLQTWTSWYDFLDTQESLFCWDATDRCSYDGDAGNPVVLVDSMKNICLAGIHLYTNDKCLEPSGRLIGTNLAYIQGLYINRKRTADKNEKENLYLLGNRLEWV
ncbi:uncharacterized protein LOC142345546 [Convolutriloba macropyga]|uniref:uncharacterized protein LOC142345546 n=1 Tax=Convolutriloba macropyga TaxID=536237 RepID=UPI003F520A9D